MSTDTREHLTFDDVGQAIEELRAARRWVYVPDHETADRLGAAVLMYGWHHVTIIVSAGVPTGKVVISAIDPDRSIDLPDFKFDQKA